MKVRNAHFCRPTLVVVYNVLAPLLRDPDIFISNVIEGMPNCAITIPIPQRHIEESVAREARHSAGVSALLVLYRLRLGPLLAVVATGCRLAALIHPLDSAILLGSFRPVPG